MPDCLMSGLSAGGRTWVLFGVPIPIPAREAAACNLYREAMPRLEDVGD